MGKFWNKWVQPSTKDTSRSLNITYDDDDDIFALVGIDSKISRWIKPRVQSKYTAILISVMIVIAIILVYTAMDSLIYYAWNFMIILVALILEILFLLGMNRAALKEVLRSFKFLFKIYEGIVFQVYYILNDYHLNPNFDWALRIAWALETAVLIFVIAALDASSLNYKLKCLMAAVVATAFTGCAITYRFDWFGNGEHVVDVVDVTEIQTKEAFVKAAQILAIFYWQQALVIFRGAPTGQSATIAYNPYITWALQGDEKGLAEAEKAGKEGKEEGTVNAKDSVQSGQTVTAP